MFIKRFNARYNTNYWHLERIKYPIALKLANFIVTLHFFFVTSTIFFFVGNFYELQDKCFQIKLPHEMQF